MSCSDYQNQFTDFLTGNLGENEKQELENHLLSCPGCRLEFQEFQKTWELMEEVSSIEPSEMMRPAFNNLLQEYREKNRSLQHSSRDDRYGFPGIWRISKRWAWVYGFGLIILGLVIGYFMHSPKQGEIAATKNQVDSLSAEVLEMKQTLTLSLLENPSASERMRAVNYTEEVRQLSPGVAEALLTTLNNDPNVNVRLVALQALAKFSDNPAIREGLIESIVQQDSPLLQAAMVDVMVRLQEKRSVQPMQELLQKKGLDEMIRTKIQQSIHKLI